MVRAENNDNKLKPAFLTDTREGFKLKWKNDGADYPAIWAAYRRGEISGSPLSRYWSFRQTDKIEAQGRKYVIKKDCYVEKRLEKKLLTLLLTEGGRYFRTFNLLNAAIEKGCPSVQDIFLVAESTDHKKPESWLIADFVPGDVLPPDSFYEKRYELAELIKTLHKYGLACNDLHPSNFIFTPEAGLTVIDVDISSPLLVCQANDLWALKRHYDISMVPEGGFFSWLIWRLIGFRDYYRQGLRRLRGKK